MSARCDLTDLRVDQCIHCLRHDQLPTLGLTISRTAVAVHDSRCAIDGQHRIEPGDRMGWATEDDGSGGIGWACPVCTEAVSNL